MGASSLQPCPVVRWRIRNWKELPQGGFLSAIACCLVFMAATNGVYRLLEHRIINHIYGQAAWDQGLRVIDKHGNLSNGDVLIWSNILLTLGTFIVSALFAVGAAILFSYLKFLIKGGQVEVTPPKKLRYWRELGASSAVARPKMNHQITASSVRIIAENGEELGIYPIADALKLVGARREDLIELEPHTDPPICQSIDYAKYRQRLRTQ